MIFATYVTAEIDHAQVELEVVVKPDGTVGDARVMRGFQASLAESLSQLAE